MRALFLFFFFFFFFFSLISLYLDDLDRAVYGDVYAIGRVCGRGCDQGSGGEQGGCGGKVEE